MNQLEAFKPASAQIAILGQSLKSLVVNSDQSASDAYQVLRDADRIAKDVEKYRKEVVKPLNDQVKLINDYAKQLTGELNLDISKTKRTLADWELAQKKAREEEAKKLEAERLEKEEALRQEAAKDVTPVAAEPSWDDLMSGETPTTDNAIAQAERVADLDRRRFEQERDHAAKMQALQSNKVKGARKVMRFEVTDISLVPRIFLVLDEVQVRKSLKEGITEIPGLRIFEDISVCVR